MKQLLFFSIKSRATNFTSLQSTKHSRESGISVYQLIPPNHHVYPQNNPPISQTLTHFRLQLTGLALLVVGILYLIDIGEVKEAIPNDFKNLELAPIFTIVVGSIIFFVAFLGCCGAVKESTCLLTSVRQKSPQEIWRCNFGFSLPSCCCRSS